MQHSKVPLCQWAMAIYTLVSNKKGASAKELASYFRLTHRTAWFLGHRLREGWRPEPIRFIGPVEVDETYVGDKERSKHGDKKLVDRWPEG